MLCVLCVCVCSEFSVFGVEVYGVALARFRDVVL